MIGEALALFAAAAYGLAGVSIVQGRAQAQGDNGVFLSIVVTAVLAWGLWLSNGRVSLVELFLGDTAAAILIFAVAGLCANVLGRQTMYRATETAGAVQTGLLRRLVPVFALPCAFVILGQVPGPQLLLGGLFVLAGVVCYLRPQKACRDDRLDPWVAFGVLSAFAYAMAYTLRGLGLLGLPDPALGTAIGASVAAVWVVVATLGCKGVKPGWRYISIDKKIAHWITAMALSTGQVLQFFALKHTTVVAVSVLGATEVLFAAALMRWWSTPETVDQTRLVTAILMAMIGTGLLISP